MMEVVLNGLFKNSNSFDFFMINIIITFFFPEMRLILTMMHKLIPMIELLPMRGSKQGNVIGFVRIYQRMR